MFLQHPRTSAACLVCLFAGCFAIAAPAKQPPKNITQIAEAYVHLVLAMGQHDKDYVDAFYGPAEWKAAAEKEKKPLAAIRSAALEALQSLEKLPAPTEELDRLRHDYLAKQLSALEARVRIVKGDKLKFDY